MIAAFGLYACVLSLIIGVLALWLERGATLLRTSTRFVWMGAMLAIILVPAALFAHGVWRAGEPMASERSVAPTAGSRPDVARAVLTATNAPDALDATERLTKAWREALASTTSRTQHLDRALLTVWAILSVSMLGIALRAMAAAKRLRHGLERRIVDGTVVYVSDEIGPAAVGGRASAIVVPRWVLSFDQSLLALVIRHEREHLTARDPALLTAALLLLALVPWHAGLWWCWRRLRLAIEIDCDRRVLRAEQSPRVYAQLLLLMSQHGARTTRHHPNVISLAVPLHPQSTQLIRRIDAMTTTYSKRRVPSLLAVAAGVLATGALVAAVPAPTPVPAPVRDFAVVTPQTPATQDAVLVSVTRVGTDQIEYDASGTMKGEILIYGSGPVKIGLGTTRPTVVADTIRLQQFSAFTADVTNGDVHVELRAKTGTIELAATVTGGPALKVGASGRHLVLVKGGTGIRTVRKE